VSPMAAASCGTLTHSLVLMCTMISTTYETSAQQLAEMGDRLATIDIGQKLGAVPFSFGERGAGSPCDSVA